MSYNMYTEIILDLYKNPLNKGTLQNKTHEFKKNNPLCGDEIKIELKIEEGIISDVKHNGGGCAISQASASLFTDFIKGKNLEELKKISKEEVLRLLNIPISSGREKCALLIYETFTNAITEVKKKQ